jgi:hypothetical protein
MGVGSAGVKASAIFIFSRASDICLVNVFSIRSKTAWQRRRFRVCRRHLPSHTFALSVPPRIAQIL